MYSRAGASTNSTLRRRGEIVGVKFDRLRIPQLTGSINGTFEFEGTLVGTTVCFEDDSGKAFEKHHLRDLMKTVYEDGYMNRKRVYAFKGTADYQVTGKLKHTASGYTNVTITALMVPFLNEALEFTRTQAKQNNDSWAAKELHEVQEFGTYFKETKLYNLQIKG